MCLVTYFVSTFRQRLVHVYIKLVDKVFFVSYTPAFPVHMNFVLVEYELTGNSGSSFGIATG